MKASQLIRELANHIAFYGDMELQFEPDLSVTTHTRCETRAEFKDKKPTGKLIVEIW